MQKQQQQQRANFPEPAPALAPPVAIHSGGTEPFPHCQQERARSREWYGEPTGNLSQTMLPDEENDYLRKNVDHLRDQKRRLEEKVRGLEQRVFGVEQRKQYYKALYEQAKEHQAAAAASGPGGFE